MKSHTSIQQALMTTCVVAIVCLCGLACDNKQQSPQTEPAIKERPDPTPSNKPTATEPVARQQPELPLEERVARLRDNVASAQAYRERIEARRTLFHELRRNDQFEEAHGELVSILDDVKSEEGDAMAQRVAFNEAGNLFELSEHNLAIRAYELLLARYPNSPFCADALTLIGRCHLKTGNYEKAEASWQSLVENHDDSRNAPWGWRKLALAQLLQGQHDAALATLEVMAEKYKGTNYGDYARVRKGYVLMADNRLSEARTSYEQFLKDCSNSKYRELAKKQLADLDQFIALANANQSQQ